MVTAGIEVKNAVTTLYREAVFAFRNRLTVIEEPAENLLGKFRLSLPFFVSQVEPHILE